VSVAIKKLDGVESVEVSLEKASADIRLKPGNAITLTQLRRLIRQAGYPTKDANIEARGALVERQGKPMLDLQNGSFLELAAKPSTPAAGVVEVTGVSRVVPKDREVLTVTDRR
jgi:copper chaperone CopZ